jgi:hypothetical protein
VEELAMALPPLPVDELVVVPPPLDELVVVVVLRVLELEPPVEGALLVEPFPPLPHATPSATSTDMRNTKRVSGVGMAARV